MSKIVYAALVVVLSFVPAKAGDKKEQVPDLSKGPLELPTPTKDEMERAKVQTDASFAKVNALAQTMPKPGDVLGDAMKDAMKAFEPAP